jgi:hypothetical protein
MKGSGLEGELKSLDLDASVSAKLQKVAGRCLLRFVRHQDTATLVLGIVVGLGVCASLLGGNRVFLLDWSIGPHVAVATPGALGLSGGLTTGVLSSVVMALLNHPLGGAVTWLPILLFFPIATVGAGRLASRSRCSRLAAGTLYAVNPFVFNRIFVGHLPLLIGYALLPFATASAIRSLSSPLSRWAVPALWWAALTALSPHFAWIFGFVVLGVCLVSGFTRKFSFQRVVGWFAISVGLYALMSTYILLPHSATNLPTQVGRVSLELYRTAGDPHLGLYANVLALYGFWRLGPGPVLPKDIISGWPFLMFTILIVVGVGIWFALRRNSGEANPRHGVRSHEISSSAFLPTEVLPPQGDRRGALWLDEGTRYLAFLLLLLGVGGYFLTLGDQGPTGWLFLWAYDHVPFFALMREPEKFLMLLALAYAVFFGWGIEYLLRLNLAKTRLGNFAVAAVVGIGLPLGYSANVFNGLGGQITPSSVPSSYQEADTLMGTGSGNILYLPWHLYMSYPFTDNRVVANIGSSEFRRSVISGDNVQAGDVQSQSTSPRSAYLQQLFSVGPSTKEFGSLISPLGVQYVVLAKTVDWLSYSWLSDQNDLKIILDTPSLEVWRNVDYTGVGWRAPKLNSVSGMKGLLALAKVGDLVGSALVTNDGGALPSHDNLTRPNEEAVDSSQLSASIQELSPVAYRIPAGRSGWVSVDAPYQRGWSLDGRAAIESAEGTLLIKVGSRAGVLQYTPWRLVRLGYVISFFTFVLLLVLVVVGHQLTNRKSKQQGEFGRTPERQSEESPPT